MIKTYHEILVNLLRDEYGQDLVEYALIAAFIALGAITTMHGLANSISNTFNTFGNKLNNVSA